MDIKKASGVYEVYEPEKLCRSLEMSGAPKDVAKQICQKVSDKITPNMSSTRVWRMALSHLKKIDIRASATYSLPRAMAGLGPTGFLFEQFIEAIMQVNDYHTRRGVMVRGRSGVEHEIDVLAKKGTRRIYVEAKYKNKYGLKTHIDHVMYAYARFSDIVDRVKVKSSNAEYESWLVTNTKFTGHAKKYGRYRGMKLIGWHYPRKGNLLEMILEKNLWPITVLPSMNNNIKKALTGKGIILAQDLITYDKGFLHKECGASEKVAAALIKEVHDLVFTG